jgi:uncharacterized membrane protein YccC
VVLVTEGVVGSTAWPPAAVATVIASLGAAALSCVGALVVSAWSARRRRHDVARDERDRYWQRLSSALDWMLSPDVGRARVGFLLAEAMYDMREIPPGEESFAIVVAEFIDRERGADG